jgi:hypothetical protein
MIDRNFRISANESSRCVDARTPYARNSETKSESSGAPDIAGSEVDLLKDTMCHYLGGRQLCCGPGG